MIQLIMGIMLYLLGIFAGTDVSINDISTIQDAVYIIRDTIVLLTGLALMASGSDHILKGK